MNMTHLKNFYHNDNLSFSYTRDIDNVVDIKIKGKYEKNKI